MLRRNYTIANDAESIRQLGAADEKYQERIDTSEREAALYARTHFSDDPSRVSGWLHHFVCPKCATTMKFDPEMEYNPPNVYTCPRCGATASGAVYDAAWVHCHRTMHADLLESCAVCALLGDTESLQHIFRVLDYYAERYELFLPHGKHVGRGRVMYQSLDEAVWGAKLLQALTTLGDLVPAEKKEYWYKNLFRPMADHLMPQTNAFANIMVWHLSTIGMIGLYFGRDELLHYALDGEDGLRVRLPIGFTEDGLWREGSLGYHFYTLHALTHFMSMYALRAPEDPIFAFAERAYTAPYLLSEDGFYLPAMNDSSYRDSIANKANLFLRASRMFDSPALAFQLAEIRRRAPGRLYSATALLTALPQQLDEASSEKPTDTASLSLLAASRLAVIHRPIHAVLKSGSIAETHRHLDCMSLSLAPFAEDLGTPGYAHPMTSAWYRTTCSHNTLCVDGPQPYRMLPNHIESVPGGVRAVIDGDWQAVKSASRTVTAEGNRLLDTVLVEGNGEHTYDWFFHSLGEAKFNVSGVACGPLGDKGGYEYFSDVQKMDVTDTFVATFTLENGRSLTLTVPGASDYEIYTAKSPSSPADLFRTTVMLHRRGENADFTVFYTQSCPADTH